MTGQPSAQPYVSFTNPTLLIEVLSESTEAYDRGEKSAHYLRLPDRAACRGVPSARGPRAEGRGHLAREVARGGETVTLGGERIAVDEISRRSPRRAHLEGFDVIVPGA